VHVVTDTHVVLVANVDGALHVGPVRDAIYNTAQFRFISSGISAIFRGQAAGPRLPIHLSERNVEELLSAHSVSGRLVDRRCYQGNVAVTVRSIARQRSLLRAAPSEKDF
jgi:hypothetical protein